MVEIVEKQMAAFHSINITAAATIDDVNQLDMFGFLNECSFLKKRCYIILM